MNWLIPKGSRGFQLGVIMSTVSKNTQEEVCRSIVFSLAFSLSLSVSPP